jgi:hypothetical protein
MISIHRTVRLSIMVQRLDLFGRSPDYQQTIRQRPLGLLGEDLR